MTLNLSRRRRREQTNHNVPLALASVSKILLLSFFVVLLSGGGYNLGVHVQFPILRVDGFVLEPSTGTRQKSKGHTVPKVLSEHLHSFNSFALASSSVENPDVTEPQQDGSTESRSLEAVRSMSIRDIKQELKLLGVSTADVFEKEELVQRLLIARDKQGRPPEIKSGPQPTQSPSSSANTRTATSSSGTVTSPLFLTSLDQGARIAAVNVPGGGISIDSTTSPPYATIQIQVQQPGSSSSFPLSLLLDTACSGFVLRPSVVQKYNLPALDTPVTMTGAGGTNGVTGLTQLQSFHLVTTDSNASTGPSFGPLPAAVQDIGALPQSLDGIIGLSFLSQFAAIDLDFVNGVVSFHKEAGSVPSKPLESDAMSVIAETEMKYVSRLGLYTADITLGGRGPVRMLVDSGASCTLLNWQGVSDLGLSRQSPQVSPVSNFGAMGSDNVAIQLTHRLNVSSNINLVGSGRASSFPGLSLAGSSRLSVDVGSIPVLDTLNDQGVGGILGVDVMLRCSAVRFTMKGTPKLTLFQ